MLRCIIETPSTVDKRESASNLLQFLKTLRVAQKSYDWDLAALCIETCGQPIETIAAANHVDMATPPATDSTPGLPPAEPESSELRADTEMQSAAMDGAAMPFSLDLPWDHLWDDMAEPWLLLDQNLDVQ